MILKWIRLGIAPWEPDFYLEEKDQYPGTERL